MHTSLRRQPALRKLWLAAQAREDLAPATRKMHFLQSLKCTAKYERKAREQNASLIAGVDEVGVVHIGACIHERDDRAVERFCAGRIPGSGEDGPAP